MATRRLSGIASSSSVPDNGGDHSGGGGSAGGASDDVFSTYLYKGTGAAQDIENGIDLAGEGGLVWLKRRDTYEDNYLHDTERGTGLRLLSNSVSANQTIGLSSFNADGFSVAASQYIASGADYVSWTFRKCPQFFDVVTYTGDSTVGREIPHNLGCEPGMVIVKRTNGSSDWPVYHKDRGASQGKLNQNADFRWSYISGASDTTFTIADSGADTNQSGGEYLAYLFAHDDSDESLIKCGSYTGNSSSGPEIDLGWEPQWLMIKPSSYSGDGWFIFDSMRGITNGGGDARLYANDPGAENAFNSYLDLTATGFKPIGGTMNSNGEEYIYMAIRRPNKPAEEFEPEELFGILDNIPDSSAANSTVIPTDNEFDVIMGNPDYVRGNSTYMSSRLQGGMSVTTNADGAEYTSAQFYLDYMKAFRQGIGNGVDFLAYTFKRQPGFFDEVCYEGDGDADSEVQHNLGVAPEMIWAKCRDFQEDWGVWHKGTGNENESMTKLRLNVSASAQFLSHPQNGNEETFQPQSIYGNAHQNFAGQNYVAYLFASVPGISKVGIYTATGTGLDVDCGFTNGARFVLIKRSEADGDWIYYDTVRGITDSTDPALKLNTTDAQAGFGTIKPYSGGFNVSGSVLDYVNTFSGVPGEYIFYAIA